MSQHKQPDPIEGVVTSDAVQSKKSFSKVLLMGIGAVIVLVIIAAGLLFYHYKLSNTDKSLASTQKAGQASSQQKVMLTINSAQAQVSNAKTAQQKALAYRDLGIMYANKDNYTQAIAAYDQAISADSSVKTETLNLLAYAYATDGQRDKAIAAYQELINLLQQQSSGTGHAAFVYGQNPIQVYQNDMQVLEEGGSL